MNKTIKKNSAEQLKFCRTKVLTNDEFWEIVDIYEQHPTIRDAVDLLTDAYIKKGSHDLIQIYADYKLLTRKRVTAFAANLIKKKLFIDYKDLFIKTFNVLIEKNGGSIEQALDDIKIFDLKYRKTIKNWFNWEDE